MDGQKAVILAQVGHFYFGAAGQYYFGANCYVCSTFETGHVAWRSSRRLGDWKWPPRAEESSLPKVSSMPHR